MLLHLKDNYSAEGMGGVGAARCASVQLRVCLAYMHCSMSQHPAVVVWLYGCIVLDLAVCVVCLLKVWCVCCIALLKLMLVLLLPPYHN
jgi:hypothetical protein